MRFILSPPVRIVRRKENAVCLVFYSGLPHFLFVDRLCIYAGDLAHPLHQLGLGVDSAMLIGQFGRFVRDLLQSQQEPLGTLSAKAEGFIQGYHRHPHEPLGLTI